MCLSGEVGQSKLNEVPSIWHPHVRFSIRRMIIVVAVLALIFSSPNRAGALRSWVAPRIWPVTLLIKCYHDKMFKKYEYLAWHPWISADPDPPPPGFNLIID